MNRSDVSVLPPTPSLVRSIRAGFDAIANHFLLIAFPLILDLFLWLGPHLRITTLTRSLTDRLFALYQSQDPSLSETLRISQEAWRLIAEQFNLMAILRSYPVGIPSLLVGRLPIANPLGTPQSLEVLIFCTGCTRLASPCPGWSPFGYALFCSGGPSHPGRQS